jgi:hypothetical protein
MAAERQGCAYREETVAYLLEHYYREQNRPLRRCHPRDLVKQLRHYCDYNMLPLELLPEHIDQIATTFFTAVPIKTQVPYHRDHA